MFPYDANIAYNFRRADHLSLYGELLKYDWSFVENYPDVDSTLDAFYKALYSIFGLHIPQKRATNHSYSPWFTNTIKQNLKLKNYYHKMWSKTKNLTHYNKVKRLRNTTKEDIKNAYNQYLLQIERNVKDNASSIWTFLNMYNLKNL